jgi:phosphoglycerol transferase MdoB-like AlkP superfamily enzyme
MLDRLVYIWKKNIDTFLSHAQTLAVIYAIFIVLMACFRAAFLIRFFPTAGLDGFETDLLHSFWVGFKFDSRVVASICILPVLAHILTGIIPVHRIQENIQKLSPPVLVGFLSLSLVILVVDQFYYQYFQAHINILAFGLIEDDTYAVWQSLWNDHPFVRVSIFVVGLVTFCWYCIRKIYKYNFIMGSTHPYSLKTCYLVLFTALIGIAARGSLGVFPLGPDDTTISKNKFINFLTTNGVMSLADAIAEHQRFDMNLDKDESIKKFGYASIQQVYSDLSLDQNADLAKDLFSETPNDPFLASNPPHVVFILMESMSGHFLKFHSKSFNILGALEPHIQEDWFFKNFTSFGDGTIHSLENLLVGTPSAPLAQSSFRFISFESSVAFPYYQAGYETSFITGGKLGWRNLQDFIPRQYYNNIEGQASIVHHNENAKTNTWGVYDQYVFDEITRKLENATKPQFIFALTTSNHSPYELPSDFKHPLQTLPDEVKNSIVSSQSNALNHFSTYYYTNDSVGKFISQIKGTDLGKKTIISFSGDHNARGLFNYSDEMLLNKYAVPFYIYAPKRYRRKQVFDPSRFGSHKDIFPTLFHLSLSGKRYFKTGNNMVSKTGDFYALHANTLFFPQGAISGSISYKWKTPSKQKLVPSDQNKDFEAIQTKANALQAARDYYIRSQDQDIQIKNN